MDDRWTRPPVRRRLGWRRQNVSRRDSPETGRKSDRGDSGSRAFKESFPPASPLVFPQSGPASLAHVPDQVVFSDKTAPRRRWSSTLGSSETGAKGSRSPPVRPDDKPSYVCSALWCGRVCSLSALRWRPTTADDALSPPSTTRHRRTTALKKPSDNARCEPSQDVATASVCPGEARATGSAFGAAISSWANDLLLSDSSACDDDTFSGLDARATFGCRPSEEGVRGVRILADPLDDARRFSGLERCRFQRWSGTRQNPTCR